MVHILLIVVGFFQVPAQPVPGRDRSIGLQEGVVATLQGPSICGSSPAVEQQRVTHHITITIPRLVGSRQTVQTEVESKLESGSRFLRDINGEHDISCCVSLTLDRADILEPRPEHADEDQEIIDDLVDVRQGPDGVDDLVQAKVLGAHTVVVVKSWQIVGERGTVQGISYPTIGRSVVIRKATAETWIHEFGHLQGFMGYAGVEDVNKIMYEVLRDPNRREREVGCLDCERFRSVIANRSTVTTDPLNENTPTCQTFGSESPPDGGLAAPTGADSGVSHSSGDDGSAGCFNSSVVGARNPPAFGFWMLALGLIFQSRRRRGRNALGRIASFLTLALSVFGCQATIPSQVSVTTDARVPSADAGPRGCLDEDGDTFGDGCVAGPDCDDTQADIHVGALERCDYLDNDCNGEVDDGTRAGMQCDAGYEGCPLAGMFTCTPSGDETCVATFIPDEICDGLDNDCDGSVDEGDLTGEPECATLLPGTCAAGVVRCDSGDVVCAPLREPSEFEELCNGVDDDCDGLTDEGADGEPLARSCPDDATDVGNCEVGSRVCSNGLLGPCAGAVFPGIETCDGADNDCNDSIDELADCSCAPPSTRECYTGAQNTIDVGECHGGTQSCGTETWGPCEGEVLPTSELCDGLDNDCDGAFDEGLGKGAPCVAGLGSCRAEGTVVCRMDGGVECSADDMSPSDEVCNGADDDCNGVIDDVMGAGVPCISSLGDCAAPGLMICNAETGELQCTGTPGSPHSELCDGRDNDCDGAIDEDLGLGSICTVGIGVCERNGFVVCDDALEATCSATSPGLPGPELCDGLDNDCDGAVDDGLGLGNDCSGVGACGDGIYECSPLHEVVCSTLPGGSEYNAAEHAESYMVCNNVDEDCNGITDDYFRLGSVYALDMPCTASCSGEARDGIYECRSDHSGMQCSADSGGTDTEPDATCDNNDNDCDGTMDNGFGTGTGCTVGVGACEVSGVMVCNEDGDVSFCDADPGLPGTESCNDIDDNCDGATDEGNPGGGGACSLGTGACLDSGTLVCSGGSLVCDATPGTPTSEVCNGIDDDCDGSTDEADSGGPLTQDCYTGAEETEDVGLCHGGTQVCDAGAFGVCVGEVTPVPEICNGLDENCDGVVNDGNPGGGIDCDGPDSDACKEGLTNCVGGAIACSDSTGDTVELCGNSLDDDCDTFTDETAENGGCTPP